MPDVLLEYDCPSLGCVSVKSLERVIYSENHYESVKAVGFLPGPRFKKLVSVYSCTRCVIYNHSSVGYGRTIRKIVFAS